MSIILIGTDDRCFCDAASKCVLGKRGSQLRCNHKDLDDKGYRTIKVADEKSSKEVVKAMTIDGYNHTLKIRDVKC